MNKVIWTEEHLPSKATCELGLDPRTERGITLKPSVAKGSQ